MEPRAVEEVGRPGLGRQHRAQSGLVEEVEACHPVEEVRVWAEASLECLEDHSLGEESTGGHRRGMEMVGRGTRASGRWISRSFPT